jgi:predicted house-cleaning NTP pyrophosphatase (Maf/HAM1 superfamily)
VFISGIRGCYYNVMGLPVSQLYHSINSLAETC